MNKQEYENAMTHTHGDPDEMIGVSTLRIKTLESALSEAKEVVEMAIRYLLLSMLLNLALIWLVAIGT